VCVCACVCRELQIRAACAGLCPKKRPCSPVAMPPLARVRAVNTAARMEQTAAPSTIQVSHATKRLLPSLDIGLVHNGSVAMKVGKGGRRGEGTAEAAAAPLMRRP